MSWLDDTEQHRKRQVALLAKAFGGNDIQKATGNDVSEDEEKKLKKKTTPYGGKSDVYKMKMLGLRKFNEQDQKSYIGVEDVANSYITNQENGDIVISKTTDGYLVSKFPIDAENEDGEEKTVTTISEAIDVALQYKDDLDNAKAPEQIMYKETKDDDDSEKGFDDEINPFERAAWEAQQDELRKAYETLGFDYDIEKAKHQDGDMHPNGKWVWRASANGGKGDWRVANPKRGGGAKKTATSSAASSNTSTAQKQDGKQSYIQRPIADIQSDIKTGKDDLKKLEDDKSFFVAKHGQEWYDRVYRNHSNRLKELEAELKQAQQNKPSTDQNNAKKLWEQQLSVTDTETVEKIAYSSLSNYSKDSNITQWKIDAAMKEYKRRKQAQKTDTKKRPPTSTPQNTSDKPSRAKTFDEVRATALTVPGITLFEEVKTKEGDRGIKVGNKVSHSIRWFDEYKGNDGRQYLAMLRKRLKVLEQKHDENERLSKVKTRDDFWKYLQSIGEADPKRGLVGYDINSFVKTAKDELQSERLIRDVEIPITKYIINEQNDKR